MQGAFAAKQQAPITAPVFANRARLLFPQDWFQTTQIGVLQPCCNLRLSA
jgi:hypothetical protein